MVRVCLPVQVIQETWVPSLGREDPLEEGMVTHSSVPAWRIPWTEEPGRLQSCERVTGRKARGLQTEERGCTCQTFFSLKQQEKTNQG